MSPRAFTFTVINTYDEPCDTYLVVHALGAAPGVAPELDCLARAALEPKTFHNRRFGVGKPALPCALRVGFSETFESLPPSPTFGWGPDVAATLRDRLGVDHSPDARALSRLLAKPALTASPQRKGATFCTAALHQPAWAAHGCTLQIDTPPDRRSVIYVQQWRVAASVQPSSAPHAVAGLPDNASFEGAVTLVFPSDEELYVLRTATNVRQRPWPKRVFEWSRAVWHAIVEGRLLRPSTSP